MDMKNNKKGVSPVVSTVLLIMIVIILAIIILIWSLGLIKEAITKEVGGVTKSIDQYCVDVQNEIQPNVNPDGNSFGFTNTGSVPIYSFNLKLNLKDSGKSSTIEITPEKGAVNPGYNVMINTADYGLESYDSYEKITIIPVLLGSKSKSGGTEPYTCADRYGATV
jgi:flagellin-like protein